jgi:hypothetical protein
MAGKQWAENLSRYNSNMYGPLLGVSDEGSAVDIITTVALGSSKMMALGEQDVNKTGMIVDGERMTSAGECPIGPDEYDLIVAATRGKTNCSTNVGVRLNTRYYQQHPEVLLSDYIADKVRFLNQLTDIFKPFIQTPDGVPRPLKLRINVNVADYRGSLAALLTEIEQARTEGKIGNAQQHLITLLLEIKDVISKEKHQSILQEYISTCADLKVRELCIDGYVIEYGRKRLSSNGLLNIIEAPLLHELLVLASKSGVVLRYRYSIDIASAARTVWTGLHTARSYGLNAGKYGLVPLIFEEQEQVIRSIQQWMHDWTAIPAFYVDIPLLSKSGLYFGDNIKSGLFKWLDMVAGTGVCTVLIDCPDRIVRRRLLKTNDNDPVGVLTMNDVQEILAYAEKLQLKVLWSGGITYAQAHAFGKLKVFGIFTTSTTAKRIAVGNVLIDDPVLPFEMEPTEKGIKLVHSLLQAGFLVSSLEGETAQQITAKTDHLLSVITPGGLDAVADEDLTDYMQLLTSAWKHLLNKQ